MPNNTPNASKKVNISLIFMMLGLFTYLSGAFMGLMGMPFSAILTILGATFVLYLGFKIFAINTTTVNTNFNKRA